MDVMINIHFNVWTTLWLTDLSSYWRISIALDRNATGLLLEDRGEQERTYGCHDQHTHFGACTPALLRDTFFFIGRISIALSWNASGRQGKV